MGTIYRITHKASGITYVGSTENVERRWGEHKARLRHGRHSNEYLQRAFDKYGEDAFGWAVLEEGVANETLIAREQYWLDTYRKHSEVYNIGECADNAQRGHALTEEHRRKIGEALRGHVVSEETRRKMSAANKGVNNPNWGKRFTAAHRQKISAANKGNQYALGHKQTAEHKRKIGEAHAKPYPAFIHRGTGIVICAGKDLKAMCERRGIDSKGMYAVKNGKRKSHKGWTLLKEENDNSR